MFFKNVEMTNESSERVLVEEKQYDMFGYLSFRMSDPFFATSGVDAALPGH